MSQTSDHSTDSSPSDSSIPGGPNSPGPFVVGIGTSADGLEALESLFDALPDDPGLSFIVVQHLAPDRESNLGGVLRETTDMEVEEAADGTPLRPNHVYVLTPDRQLSIEEGCLHLDALPAMDGGRTTIDFLFRSLAEQCGGRAIGVLLSGTGSDGTTGLRIIREAGGMTLAQEPSEADVVDFVAPVEQLADHLIDLADHHRNLGPLQAPEELDVDALRELDRITALLRDRTGTDLSKYKRPTVLRRIGRRMQVHQIETLSAYRRHLERHLEELDELFDELLIGVTGFFRDPEAWKALDQQVVPALFDGKSDDDEVRVWVPGCSTGEEAYTLALLLSRYADELANPPEIKIFGTDISRDAIEFARRGSYPSAIVSDVPDDLLSRYFRAADGGFRVAKKVRRRVMFAPQNVLTDPPFSALDLITCRNLLIYLESDAQRRLLELIYYALEDDGFLMLGESETTTQRPDLFESFDKQHRIYRVDPDSELESHPVRPAFNFEPAQLPPQNLPSTEPAEDDVEGVHREAIVSRHAPPSVLVDEDYELLHVVGDVQPYLAIRPGKSTGNLLEMLSEEAQSSVRTMLFEAFHSNDGPVHRRLEIDGDPVDLEACPVKSEYVELSFHTPPHPEAVPSEPSADADDRVDQLEGELEETRRRLQSTIREYESTNERLRASNEELMSMNEELQSTTEELQTSKEELQSMNEEMTTVNEELNDKIEQLDAANADLRNLLRSTDIGTIFLDRDLTIKRFTEPVTDYVNLIPSDEGRPIIDVSHGIGGRDWVEDARRAMEEPTRLEREIEDEDGHHLLVRIMPYLDVDDEIDGAVLTFIDITDRKAVERELARSEQKFRSVFDQAADAMFLFHLEDDSPGPLVETNEAAVSAAGLSRDDLERLTIADILRGPNFDLDDHLRELSETGETRTEALLENFGDGDPTPVEVRARCIEVAGTDLVVELLRDLSDRKRYEEALVDKRRAQELAELRSMFLATLSHDIRSPLAAIVTMTGLLGRQVGDEHTDLVDRIERSTKQLRKILDSILRMARLDLDEPMAEPERIELVDQIRHVTDVHKPLAERKGLELTYEGPDPPIEARIDPQLLAQVLNNLIDNAIKFTVEGRITVRFEATDAAVRISVADTGSGIPDEEIGRLFERADIGPLESEDYYSEGLGLAITDQLVDAMGGSVEVESAEGEGSTFIVEIPREA